MEERMLDEAPREVWEERGKRLKIDLERRWDNFMQSDLVTGKNYTNFAQEQTAKTARMDASMAKSYNNRGAQLNDAAMNKVGLSGPAGGGTAINAPTINNINNATVMPARATSARHLGKVSGEDMDRLVS